MTVSDPLTHHTSFYRYSVINIALNCDIIWQAESLYNSCDFEHAMAVFSHGLRISPGFEGFTIGVAKVEYIYNL